MKYPFVKQEEMKDCGIACLEMIIKYYGGFVKRNTLFEMTKTNKNGTTLFHLNDTLTNFSSSRAFLYAEAYTFLAIISSNNSCISY